MKINQIMTGLVCAAMAVTAAAAQTTTNAGEWKTWIIASGKDHQVPPPPDAAATRAELEWTKAATAETNPHVIEQMKYWNAGPPSYRWIEMVTKRQSTGQPIGRSMVHAYTYVSMAVYDATVAAWSAKHQYNRQRPSAMDSSVTPRVEVPLSPSYPSDYAASAAAAATVMAFLVPAEAEAFQSMAEEAGRSRLYAGVEYPSDYLAGMALGKRVAEQVIARLKADGSDIPWTGVVPAGDCKWTGSNPANAWAMHWKPLLMTSPSEFRPAPPPPCNSPELQADLATVKAFPRAATTPNLMTNAKALYWQTPEGVFPWAYVQLSKWVLEDKLSAPEAARAFALLGAVGFDAFIASQDAKFTYWYPRPGMLDSSLTTLFAAPNFPSYPSNHSTFSTARSEVLAYLFPSRADAIRMMGKEAGDSRIWAGIHYEIDNQAGVKLGKDVAQKFIQWAEGDGSGR